MTSSRPSTERALSFETRQLDVALVGPGRVGSAFAAALAARGHRLVAVAASTEEGAAAGAVTLGGRAASPEEAASLAGLVVIAVPDDVLEEVAGRVAGGIRPGTWVVHSSGRSGAAALAACGERVAAIHPAIPIAAGGPLEGAAAGGPLEGAAFGVSCAEAAWPFAAWLVAELGGTAVRIPEEDRVLYHAALVIGSNFTTALAADALDLAGREVVMPLLRRTLENLEVLDPGAAMTGPVVRGDAGTVRAHLAAIDERAPHLREAYVACSRRLVARALAAGRITAVQAGDLERALAGRDTP